MILLIKDCWKKRFKKELAEEDKLKQEVTEDANNNLNEWLNMGLDHFQPCLP